MSTTTPVHQFLKWIDGTLAADVAFNDLIDKLDVRVSLSVISDSTTAQPASPSEGDRYIIPAGATGAAWGTFTQNNIAHYRDAAWVQFTPTRGLLAEVQDLSAWKGWNGTSWATVSGSGFLTSADIDTLAELNAIVADATIASQAYVDAALVGLVDLQGDYNASTNSPDLDTAPSGINKGDAWEVSAAGDFFTEAVEVGDFLIAKQDNPTTLAHWTVVNKNIKESDIFEFSVDVETVADQDYVLWWDAPFAGSITKIRTKTQSGTCTVTGKIGATALGGTANSATTTASEQDHSTSNTFAKGDKILFTVSANSAATDLSVIFYGARS